MYVSTSGYRHIIQRPARFWEPNYIICLVLIEPQSFEEAMACEESSQWLQAMKEETISLKKNKSCHYCITQISYKWVYWIKQKTDGSVDWFKIRLCAKGYLQTDGIDYQKIFWPIDSIRITIRILLVLALK